MVLLQSLELKLLDLQKKQEQILEEIANTFFLFLNKPNILLLNSYKNLSFILIDSVHFFNLLRLII